MKALMERLILTVGKAVWQKGKRWLTRRQGRAENDPFDLFLNQLNTLEHWPIDPGTLMERLQIAPQDMYKHLDHGIEEGFIEAKLRTSSAWSGSFTKIIRITGVTTRGKVHLDQRGYDP